MYACFEGKPQISLWCDGKEPPESECESSDEDGGRSKKKKMKKSGSLGRQRLINRKKN